MEILEIALKNRLVKICYHTATFLLCATSMGLSLWIWAPLIHTLPKCFWPTPLLAFFIVPAILHYVLNSFIHLKLIFHSIHGVSFQMLSSQCDSISWLLNSNFNYFSIYALKPSNWPTLNACTDTTRGFLIHNQVESYILHHLYVLLHRSNWVPSFYHKFIAKISDYIDMDTPSHSMLYYLIGYGNIYVKHIYVKLKL